MKLDMDAGYFDVTLAKYKPQKQPLEYAGSRPTVAAIFQQFVEFKRLQVEPKTLEKYNATLRYASDFFEGRLAEFIGLQEMGHSVVFPFCRPCHLLAPYRN